VVYPLAEFVVDTMGAEWQGMAQREES